MSKEELDELARIAAALNAPTKLIAKSEHIPELEKELEIARSLRVKAEKLVPAWKLNKDDTVDHCGKMPVFSFEQLQFSEFDQGEEGKLVFQYVWSTRNQAFHFLRCMHSAICNIYQNLCNVEMTLEHNLEMEKKGTTGEIGVENYLRRNLSCRIMNSVILPSVQAGENAPKTAETDLLVISHNGVYVCEIKNYGKAGQTLEIQPNGSIAKLDYYGRFLENMGSPTAQNQHHCAAVAKVLADAGLPQIPVYSVIIIANTEVNISNHSTHAVMDMYSFRDMVNKDFNGQTITEEEMQSVYAAITTRRMMERKFPIVAVSQIQTQVETALTQIECVAGKYKEWRSDSGAAFRNNISQANEIWLRAHPKLAINRKLWRRVKGTAGSWLIWGLMVWVSAYLDERGYETHFSYQMIAVLMFILENPTVGIGESRNMVAKNVYISNRESSLWVSVQNLLLLIIAIIRFTMPFWVYLIYLKFDIFPNWN